MITAKEALINVQKFVTDTFTEGSIVIAGVEEIEKSEDGAQWYVTLSFVDNSLPGKIVKSLKVFTVDRDTGEVESMRIWQSPITDCPF